MGQTRRPPKIHLLCREVTTKLIGERFGSPYESDSCKFVGILAADYADYEHSYDLDIPLDNTFGRAAFGFFHGKLKRLANVLLI
jgi:hypothetical protein